MTDFFTQVGNGNTQKIDKRKDSRNKNSLLKIILVAAIPVLGSIIVALINKPGFSGVIHKLLGF